MTKKRIILILSLVVFFCAGFCLYMESRYSMTEYVDADMTSAEVLEEKSYLARGE